MSKKKKIIILSVCICLALALMGGTLAWFLREDAKRAQTEGATVMAPYTLYLLNPNAQDALQFAIGNLHPGETKQTVICVSNKRPKKQTDDDLEEDDTSDIAKDSEFGYDLMLVHTENLAVHYTFYPLERFNIDDKPKLNENDIIMDDDTKGQYFWNKKQDGDKKDIVLVSENQEEFTDTMRESVGIVEETYNGQLPVNSGVYQLYSDGYEGNNMRLKYEKTEEGEGVYKYDYYLIEIKWDDDIDDFDSYKKETDMVYVVVNAKQPRPIMQGESIIPGEGSDESQDESQIGD